MNRRAHLRLIAGAIALGILAFGLQLRPGAVAASADAASCVRISGGVFNAPDNDNYMPYLNQEFIRVRNYCSTYKVMTGWKLHDYERKHTYTFPTGYKIYPGYNVTIHSGTGTNGKYNLYWQRSYGAVWNNTAPEKAYLRKPDGTLASSWTEY